MNDRIKVHFEKLNRHKSLKRERGGGRGLGLRHTARGPQRRIIQSYTASAGLAEYKDSSFAISGNLTTLCRSQFIRNKRLIHVHAHHNSDPARI